MSLCKAAADVSPSGVFDGVYGLFHSAADLRVSGAHQEEVDGVVDAEQQASHSLERRVALPGVPTVRKKFECFSRIAEDQ